MTYEEINVLYDFDENGGLDDEEEGDDESNYEGCVSTKMDIENNFFLNNIILSNIDFIFQEIDVNI